MLSSELQNGVDVKSFLDYNSLSKSVLYDGYHLTDTVRSCSFLSVDPVFPSIVLFILEL